MSQAFHVGLMLVYSVVLGDMLVGEKHDGLICGGLGGIACSRPLVVGIVTLLVLVPLISVRLLPFQAHSFKLSQG